MEYAYKRRSYKADYIIDGKKLIVKEGYLSPPVEIDLASGAYKIREGLIFHQGLQLILAAFIIPFPLAFTLSNWNGEMQRLVLSCLPLAFLAGGLFIFGYLKFGFLLSGLTIKFPTGEKINVIKDNTNATAYNTFVNQIKIIKATPPAQTQ